MDSNAQSTRDWKNYYQKGVNELATYAKKGESVDSLLKRFKREVLKSGITAELRKREAYIAPSAKKRLKHEQALKRARKNKQ